MTTDRRDAARGRSSQAAGDRSGFGRLVAIILVALVVVGGGAAVVGLTQGPKLVRTVVDPTGLVESWGQRVVLAVNQPIADLGADRVRIEPAADFDVSTGAGGITLVFPEPLAYATDYRITVDGVTAPGGGPAATLTTSFSTPPVEGFSLVRSPVKDGGSAATKPDDRIVRLSLGGGEPETAYEAAKIQEFATIGDSLIVVEQETSGLGRIVVVDTTDGSTQKVALPMGGMITSLQTAPAQSRVGFLFTEQSFGRDGGDNLTLYSFELREGKPTEAARVGGIDGAAVQAAEWSFVPRTSSMLVRTVDNSLELLDPAATTDPVLLGRAALISSYIPGTTKVVIEQIDGVVVLDLATGKSEPFVLPSVAPTEIPGQLVALSESLSARMTPTTTAPPEPRSSGYWRSRTARPPSSIDLTRVPSSGHCARARTRSTSRSSSSPTSRRPASTGMPTRRCPTGPRSRSSMPARASWSGRRPVSTCPGAPARVSRSDPAPTRSRPPRRKPRDSGLHARDASGICHDPKTHVE